MSPRRFSGAAPAWLAPLRSLVANDIPAEVPGGVVTLIGEYASTYSRSPQIWAAALRHLDLEASYVVLDVPPAHLGDVLAIMRITDQWWGANVTVPHKEAVLPVLDDLEPAAAAIGAVNTVVRRTGGRLLGASTDGVGLIAALLRPDANGALIDGVYGLTVLLIGAGGAARSAAMALSPLLGSGRLLVTNRTTGRAEEIAAMVGAIGARARAVAEADVDGVLPDVGLVINASTRGQGGIRPHSHGWTCLEPYSALGPADPPVLPAAPEAEFREAWASRASAGIAANHDVSRARMRRLPRDAVVFDMIYAPSETATVRHAREAGLRVANGRQMMIAQAVEACLNHICARALAARGVDREAARDEITGVMAAAWPA